jgi:HK97 gp10 family phage protein
VPLDAQWDFKFDTQRAKRKVRAGTFEAVRDTFEIDIKTDAKANSPVKTGLNRQTIDTEVGEVQQGIAAEIFTQSGYGGFLELGTVKLKARPYIYPAFNKFRTKLMSLLKIKIAKANPDSVQIPGYKERVDNG